jgi:hypothetical protein
MTKNSNLISSQPADFGYREWHHSCFNCGNDRRSLRRVAGDGLLCRPCRGAI